jgi:hypothetical protein
MANRHLYRVRASWLTDLFPDELLIQEKTVSVVRNGFLVSAVETMPIRDVGRVVYVDTPLFAGIRVLGKNTAHELAVHGLPKKQARDARAVIEGLLLEESGDISVPQWLDSGERLEKLSREGKRSLTKGE